MTLPSTNWAKAIEAAQAFLSPTGYTQLPWPARAPARFDIEVDIDMENSADQHVYLWGALVTQNGESVYHPFVDWSCATESDESQVFERFWNWFTDLQSNATAAGLSFGAYCWNKTAENGELLRLSEGTRYEEGVRAFIACDEWIDLAKSWTTYYTTGQGWGLKRIARLAQFSWRAENAGGGQSMVYFDDQLNGRNTEESQSWLLGYNEDDCRATLEVRRWLERIASYS